MIPIVIIAIALFFSLGLLAWFQSTLLTCAVMGALSGTALVAFLIAPVFGYKHFIFSDYWILMPMLIMYVIGYLLSSYSSYKPPKENRQCKK